VLDLGTGSGCMLLSILLGCPEVAGVGVDLSAEALELAERNAQGVGVDLSARATFMKADFGQLHGHPSSGSVCGVCPLSFCMKTAVWPMSVRRLKLPSNTSALKWCCLMSARLPPPSAALRFRAIQRHRLQPTVPCS